MLSLQILPTSTWVLFTAGALQLHEGQLWAIPWGKVCQLKQLPIDMCRVGQDCALSFPPLCSCLATSLTGISPPIPILLIHMGRRGTKQSQAQPPLRL